MGSRKRRVCIWNVLELEDFRRFGKIPDCEHHEHVSRREALEFIQTLLYKRHDHNKGKDIFYYEANWVDANANSKVSAITFTDPREWQIRNSSVNGQGGMCTHQLIPVGK